MVRSEQPSIFLASRNSFRYSSLEICSFCASDSENVCNSTSCSFFICATFRYSAISLMIFTILSSILAHSFSGVPTSCSGKVPVVVYYQPKYCCIRLSKSNCVWSRAFCTSTFDLSTSATKSANWFWHSIDGNGNLIEES